MQDILDALTRAFKSLLHPKMLMLLLWPMLLALVCWGMVAWIFWESWAAGIQGWAQDMGAQERLAAWGLNWLAGWFVTALLVALLLPAIYVTALLITALFAMPLIVGFVATRDYPELEKKRGGTFAGSVWNGVVAVSAFVAGWILTLPLWLLPLGVFLAPALLAAWLNQRLFRYDALAEHASADEYVQVIERSRGRLFVLGGLLGLVHYVPVLNLFMPVYIGLAFTHLCLAELRRLRAEAARG